MARGIFEHELNDPDFKWLLEQFNSRKEDYILIGDATSPLSFVPYTPVTASSEDSEEIHADDFIPDHQMLEEESEDETEIPLLTPPDKD